MVALAAVFRRYGPASRAPCGNRRPPSHLRALHDIAPCRTESLGGQLSRCQQCHQHHDSDHSCKPRHCPPCQHAQAEQWLENQQNLVLPVTHCLVTGTLPAALRTVARRHHKTSDTLLLRTAADAFQHLAWDPRCLGGRLGMVGVLHPWTRDLRYHPHVHDIVTGGGLAPDDTWRPSRHDCLVPVTPLSGLVRATCRDARHKTALCPRVAAPVWTKDGVVPCEPVGSSQEACRDLAPYIFRVAISHNRIRTRAEGSVPFQSKTSATAQVTLSTVSAQACIRRFLQHVLPDRCITVR